MCRGLAVLCDKQGRFFSKGIDSHTRSLSKGMEEDDCLKFEVIIDDNQKSGYSIEVDNDYEKNSKQGKEAKALLTECKKWIKNNELRVLRWLLQNRTYARSKNNTDNSCQKTKGITYNSLQETEGNTDNSYQETKGNTDNSCQKTKGNTDNSYQETKGEIFVDYIKNFHKPTDDFIEMLSNKFREKGKRLTWKELVKLAKKRYEKQEGK